MKFRNMFFFALLALVLFPGSPASAAEPEKKPQQMPLMVVIKTNQGSIIAQLFPDKAPKSVENFLAYAKEGFYNGTVFHRVVPGFVIQGGGFTADKKLKDTKAPIKNEAGNGLKNLRGTLAMARTSVVDSASSQFYVNLADNASLDHKDESKSGFGYAVFGEVMSGMEVVDAIAKVKLRPGSEEPAEPVIIEKVAVMSGMGPSISGEMPGMPGGMKGMPAGMKGMPGARPSAPAAASTAKKK